MLMGQVYSCKPSEMMTIRGALSGDKIHLSIIDQYPGFWLNNHFGFDLSPFSLTYYKRQNGSYVSLNPLLLVLAMGVGYSMPLGDKEERIFDYWNSGKYISFAFLPQLLTNWSFRFDVIREKFGLIVGPRTDLFAGSSLWVRTALQSGVYFNIFKVNTQASIEYDLIEKKNRIYLQIGNI